VLENKIIKPLFTISQQEKRKRKVFTRIIAARDFYKSMLKLKSFTLAEGTDHLLVVKAKSVQKISLFSI